MTTDKEEKADTQQEHLGTDSFTYQENMVRATHDKSCQAQPAKNSFFMLMAELSIFTFTSI